MNNIVSIIFLSIISLSANDKYIMNFGKKFSIDNSSMKIMPNVIIKTELSKNELIQKLNKPIKQIAFLGKSNLFLVDSNDSLSYAYELSSYDYIIYAQPDILQRKVISVYKKQDITTSYKLKDIWKTTKGEGVNIAIIDDGFNLGHEDLKGMNLLFSYDADNKNLDSSEKLGIDTHGTQVAGIIYGQHNNIGIDGIAPNSNLIAIRQTTNLTSDTVLAFTVAQKAGADIINCSWNSPFLLEPVYDVIKHLAKKIAIVFATGNKHKEIKPFSTEASIPEVITVGATQNYSNYGDMVDFKIPSGVITTKVDGTYGNFGGTSATAPIISGLLALKLSENKNKSIKKIVNILEKELHGN